VNSAVGVPDGKKAGHKEPAFNPGTVISNFNPGQDIGATRKNNMHCNMGF
jgi:hypothetical protein